MTLSIYRFNSQRDGILPKKPLVSLLYSIVSIPNGMEFYYARTRLIKTLRLVSIPNGMEFYLENKPDTAR